MPSLRTADPRSPSPQPDQLGGGLLSLRLGGVAFVLQLGHAGVQDVLDAAVCR